MSTTPATPDQLAAHAFLSELRTRITTQPLPYQHGIESRALASLHEVFGHAREAMKKNPGCEKFAATTTEMLNMTLRPMTAKWHKPMADGWLESRDGADEFRADLEALQVKMRAFASELHVMAYGTAHADTLTPDIELEAALSAPVKFGIPKNDLISAGTTKDINDKEAAEVAARRANLKIATAAGEDAVGLAFSGGGIRSATFCLGVTQVLAEKGLLKDVDFLSTVSGGGYTGSFLTTRLGTGADISEVAAPRGPDPAPIRFLRQRAKFLTAKNFKETWGMVTATLAGLLLNWSTPFFIICASAAVAVPMKKHFDSQTTWTPVWMAIALVLVLAALVFGGCLRWCPRRANGALAFLNLSGVVAAGGFVLWGLDHSYDHVPAWLNWLGAGLGGFVAAVPSILRFVPVLKNPTARKLLLKVLMLLASVVMPLLAALAGMALFTLGKDAYWLLLVLVAAQGLIALFLLNINRTGPHRLYRNGLDRTFVQTEDDAETMSPLTGINPACKAPYHLINTAVNLPSSEQPGLRERRCDFFLFSKHWTGSPVVGYHPTAKWKMNGEDADLGTAMAISGAAFSANMGLGSMPALRALLAFLNVRLGFWIWRPGMEVENRSAPGFTCLLREMTGVAMSEKQGWLNLSDGGHIENMATYELLRRRCKFIVCVDGESDPGFTFQGLMTLVRHAQLDFGVRIDSRLDDLRPNATTGFSRSHYQLCRIHYPATKCGQPAATGLLLYVKLSVTGNESELIKRYRTNNAEYPHQTTLDQFFDEEQFEAYRQLGVHAAEGLFLPALMNGQPDPATMREWFERLSGNLLEPL